MADAAPSFHRVKLATVYTTSLIMRDENGEYLQHTDVNSTTTTIYARAQEVDASTQTAPEAVAEAMRELLRAGVLHQDRATREALVTTGARYASEMRHPVPNEEGQVIDAHIEYIVLSVDEGTPAPELPTLKPVLWVSTLHTHFPYNTDEPDYENKVAVAAFNLPARRCHMLEDSASTRHLNGHATRWRTVTNFLNGELAVTATAGDLLQHSKSREHSFVNTTLLPVGDNDDAAPPSKRARVSGM